MRLVHRALGAAVAVGAAIGVAWASSARMAPHRSDDAVLRLTWTARPERVEECHAQTNEALEKLPAHMRQAVVCDGTTASYRLEVRREGQLIAAQVVRGGGLHHDRPLYVFREIHVPPVESAISVRFVRIDSPMPSKADTGVRGDDGAGPGVDNGGAGTSAIDPERRRREREERVWQRGEAVPAELLLEDRFHFEPRHVILVTYDAGSRRLLIVQEPRRESRSHDR